MGYATQNSAQNCDTRADATRTTLQGAVLTQQETHMSCRRVGYEMCKREYTWNVDKIWECINVASDVKNCGGCMRPMTDTDLLGQDCTMIPGQKDVRCIGGSCKVLTCHPGWQLHRNKKVCTEAFDEGD
ncbi:Dihydroxyacetone synthase [Tulasnella sp. JGI-2019a]|nr:Dihydroxyacetone synthase [Tulasnella sp. JGI-2019a]